MSDKITKYKKIAILTTCEDDWGGCEELWYRSVPYLKEAGADILIYKNNFNRSNFFINTLAKDNVVLRDLRSSHNLHERVVRKLSFLIKKINDPYYHIDYPVQNFHNKLIKDKPSLVVISQAINFDGLKYAYQCLRLKIPYIIVSHKAVDFYWPSAQDKDYMRETM